MISEAKETLRMAQSKLRLSLSAKERAIKSNQVCSQLIDFVISNKPKSAHCFIPMGNEINVLPFIEYCLVNGITVVCPKTLKKPQLKHLVLTDLKSLEKGVFGTVYPSGDKEFKDQLDLIIVPGLAFDNQGGRLGYGGGYYDTFLNKQPNAVKIGVGFSNQLIEAVPMEEHDIWLDAVITV